MLLVDIGGGEGGEELDGVVGGVVEVVYVLGWSLYAVVERGSSRDLTNRYWLSVLSGWCWST